MPTLLTIISILIGLLLFYFSAKLMIFEYTAPIAKAKKGTIRIACVGDSITYGTFVKKRKKNCYPYRLEILLGKHKYSVRNFGINGHTMKKQTDHPYWKHRNFKLSSQFAPHYVILMLGTNDTKKQNWTNKEDYRENTIAMIHHYQSLPSNPRVFLMTPPKEFVVAGRNEEFYRMNNDYIIEEISVLKELSKEMHLTLIDFNTLSQKHPEWYFLDGIHLNAVGCLFLADFIYKQIKDQLK